MSAGEAADRAPPPLPTPERLQTLLFDAARIGRDDVIPALLQAGAAIEAVDDRGHSALVLASYHGHESTTALLLRHGAAPDGDPAGDGSTALMGVAFKGYLPIARRLLAGGADPNRANGAGQTALMMAALFGRTEIVELLLAAGADPRRTDIEGNNAASLARGQGQDAIADRLDATAPVEVAA